MSQEALIERLRLLMSGEGVLYKTEFAQNTLTAAIEALSAQDVARVPLTDEQRIAIQECIDYLTPAAKDFSDLGLPGMGDSKHARCIRTLRSILAAAPAAPAVAPSSARDYWQQKALDYGFQYWRASDAHGVQATKGQAVDLLQSLLGVEVEISEPKKTDDELLAWANRISCNKYAEEMDAIREVLGLEEDCDYGEIIEAIDALREDAEPAQAKQQRDNPPFANCSFRICDLPGQCRGEGKCHHPASEPITDAAEMSNAKYDALIESARNYLGALDVWDGSAKAERYTKLKEIALRGAIAALNQDTPSDCSGDPASCPDNEGRGCYCSDKERIDRANAEGEKS